MHLQYNNDHHQSAGIEHAVALAVQISNKEISTALRLAANCSMATIDEQKDNDSKGLDTVVRREAKDTGLLPDVAPKNESQVVEMERSMSTRIEFAPAQISTLLNSNASSTDITSEQHFDAQSTTIPVTLSNFELFPDLPTELRLRIWRFAGLVPQLVTLIDDGKNRRYLCGVQKNGLLFVNKEANEEVIKVRPDYYSGQSGAPKLYFNSEIDSFYLPGHATNSKIRYPFHTMTWASLKKGQFANVKSIMLNFHAFSGYQVDQNCGMRGWGYWYILSSHFEEVTWVFERQASEGESVGFKDTCLDPEDLEPVRNFMSTFLETFRRPSRSLDLQVLSWEEIGYCQMSCLEAVRDKLLKEGLAMLIVNLSNEASAKWQAPKIRFADLVYPS